MHKLRNITFIIIAIMALFIARSLSEPLIVAKDNIKDKTQNETITVGNFNNEVESSKEGIAIFENNNINYLLNGMLPLVMYILSLMCLLDLIKTSFIKFMEENSAVYKTAYLLLIVFKMALIGLISFYVAEISYGTLVIWLLAALITVQIVFHGNYLIELVKISRRM